MTVAVYEPYATGHRAGYVRWIVQGLLAAGHNAVIGGTSELLEHSALKAVLAEPRVHALSAELVKLRTRVSQSRFDGIYRQFAYRRYFSRLHAAARRRWEINGVVVPYLDYCIYAIAALGSPFGRVPWCGITMRSGDTVLGDRLTARSVMLRSLPESTYMRALYSIDPRVGGWITHHGQVASGKLHYLGDPVAVTASGDRLKLRSALAITEATTVVLVFGTLDKRKGIEALLDAMRSLEPELAVTVLLAGRQSAELRTLLSDGRYARLHGAGRIRCIDRYLEESELADVLAGADIAWLGYIGHDHMSGVFQLAAAHGLPIITTPAGALGFLAGMVSLTTAVDPTNVPMVTATLRRMVQGPRVRRASAEAEQLMTQYSPARFGATIAAGFS